MREAGSNTSTIPADSADVNAYLREITRDDFTAKDFRTWSGTLSAAAALRAVGPATSQRDGKRKIAAAIRVVADELGNTATVCRKCYIHPAVLEAYAAGLPADRCSNSTISNGSTVRRTRSTTSLTPQEAALVKLLKRAATPPSRA